MGTWVRVDAKNCFNDKELLEELKKMPNGEYAVWVCRKCGMYATANEYDEDVKIHDHCVHCMA